MPVYRRITEIPEKRFILWAFFTAFVLRAIYILTLKEQWYFFDTVYYDHAAMSLVRGEGFGPSLYFSNLYDHYCLEPLYPLFLAACYFLFGHHFWTTRLVQALIGSVSLIFLYHLAKRIFSVQIARNVLIFTIIYPFFIHITGLLYITQFFSFLLIVNLYLFYRYLESQKMGWLALAGLTLGLAGLARPIYVLSFPLFALWVLLYSRGSLLQKLGKSAFVTAMIVVVLVPWTVRNYLVFGTPSFARACVHQGEVYDNTFWAIQKEKVYAQGGFRAEKFSVNYYPEGQNIVFDFYIDDKPSYKFVPFDEITVPEDGMYTGFMLCGPNRNAVNRLKVNLRRFDKGDTLDSVIWDTQTEIPAFESVEQIRVQDGSFVFDGGEEKWEYAAVFAKKDRGNYFELFYDPETTADQGRRIALLILLDRPDLKANGYMAWFHPWGEPDLWRVVDGKPYSSIHVKKLPYDTKRFSLLHLLREYPREYVVKHFIPKFRTFWSPKVTGVRNKERRPGFFLQMVSITFFLPVLIFFPLGIWALRKKLVALLLLLIPIVTLSFGYSIYGTQTRYRIPIDGFLVLLAMAGFMWLLSCMKRKDPQTGMSGQPFKG